MKLAHMPLVIGNWKMNPQTGTSAKRLAQDLKKVLAKEDDIEVVIAPPTVFLPLIHDIRGSKKTFRLGAQNVHHENLGPFTGEVSLPMLTSYNVSHVILGHSERRRMGETDELIQKKVTAVIRAGLTAVVCVGEARRDHGAQYLGDIEKQIRSATSGLSRSKLGQLTIAYEPIWAIGTGNNATSSDVHEMKLFIEKTLSDLYGRNYAQKVRVLYGGSVNDKNAEELMRDGMIDGFLVGGASLNVKEFKGIISGVRAVCEA